MSTIIGVSLHFLSAFLFVVVGVMLEEKKYDGAAGLGFLFAIFLCVLGMLCIRGGA